MKTASPLSVGKTCTGKEYAMQDLAVTLSGYLSKLSLPSLGVTDILEIALISFFIYQFMVWIKFTRAYTLLKGILIVLLFILFAYILKMNTILWIIKNLSTILLTSQLLINIFEHNTPLHDGAVLVRGNRIVAATCYLPLSDNMELSKQLGTRHRAGVGISEVSDSLTIIVSEETGQVSVAQNGELSRGLTSAELRSALIKAQNKKVVNNSKLRHLLKGRMKHEEHKAD